MKTSPTLPTTLLALGFLLHPSSFLLSQGPLTPPGAPAPTMKTLDQIEARTPISALPFTIGTSGAYYLTGNLTAAAGGAGITVNASNVTLDLGGFALAGNAGAAQHGVRVAGAAINVTIRNGTVRTWTGDGISVANTATNTHVRVEDVSAIANAGRGIAVGSDGAAQGCRAFANAGDGIAGGVRCQVIGCTSTDQTAGSGFVLGD